MRKLLTAILIVFVATSFYFFIRENGYMNWEKVDLRLIVRKQQNQVSRSNDSVMSPSFAGKPIVIDADTIDLDGRRVRLFGIDAVEWNQLCFGDNIAWRCGVDAAVSLERMIGGRHIRCEERGRDRYHRIIAVCRLGQTDIARWLVEMGWAVAYTRFSDEYIAFEEQARKDRVGIWASTFDEPEKWRRGRRN